MQTRGRTSTIVLVVGLALAFGLIVGVAGQYVRIPTFLWIILFPTFYAYWASLIRGRRSPAGESAHAGTETVLLEASDTGRRWIQTIVPLLGTLLVLVPYCGRVGCGCARVEGLSARRGRRRRR
jgi:hypothetical protein